MELNRHAEALRCFDKVSLATKQKYIDVRRGICLMSLGREKEALTIFEKHKQYVRITEFFLRKMDYGNALRFAELAVETNSENTVAVYYKAFCLAVFGERHESLKCLDLNLKLNPKSIEAHRVKARIYCQTGDYNEAILLLTSALAIRPKCDISKKCLAVCHILLGDFPAALYSINEAIQLNGKNPRHRFVKVAVLLLEGNVYAVHDEFHLCK